MLKPLWLLVALTSSVIGAILPSTYLNPKFGQCRSNIEGYSLATFKKLVQDNYTPAGYLKSGWPYIAEWDYTHNTTTFQSAFNAANNHYATGPGPCYKDLWMVQFVNQFNDFPVWSVLGSLEGGLAYGNFNAALTQAINVFNFITEHGYITQSDINAGYLVGTKFPNVTLHAECGGKSMIYGVYWENGCSFAQGGETGLEAKENGNVNAVSSGLYAVLGSELCRQTGNMTYCDNAINSLQWIDRLLKNSDGLIVDHVNSSCIVTTTELFTYNTALYIWAYANLGNYLDNSTYLSYASNSAIAAMTTTVWNSNMGIIKEADGLNATAADFDISFPPVLINYLRRASQYFSSDLQAAITQYINIQYYGLTQLDSNNPEAPLTYGRNWTGSYVSSTPETLSAASEVLNAIRINPASAFPSSCASNVPVISA